MKGERDLSKIENLSVQHQRYNVPVHVVHTKGELRKTTPANIAFHEMIASLLSFHIISSTGYTVFALSQHLWMGALSLFVSPATLIKRRKFPHQPQHHV